jgi:hypothetical protein
MAVECFASYQQATESVDAPTKFKYLCQALHQVNAMRRHEHRKAWRALQEEKASYQFERFCRTPSHFDQSPAQSNQSQSHHIKVDQGEKIGERPTSNTQHPTSNIQRNTNRQTSNTKKSSNSNLQSSPATQSNPGKSDYIKVDQGGKKVSLAGCQVSGWAGTDLVSKAIAEVFGAQMGNGKGMVKHQNDSTVQRFNDSTTPPANFSCSLGFITG